MRDFRFLEKSPLLNFALASFLFLGAQHLSGQPVSPQQHSASQVNQIEDAENRAGPFDLSGHDYSVLLREKHLAKSGDTAFAQTLAGLEIRDAAGIISYQKSFPFTVEQGRFQRSLSASAQVASGKTGAGLIIYYKEQAAAPQTGWPQFSESWQIFGPVNGKLAPLGKPLPIGEGMAGGPFMGVMMRAANGAVSVISEPDTVEVRAWSGNFYVFVPLRVDWNHGGLTQGQRCMEMIAGGLQEKGCEMRVEANRKPSSEEFGFVRYFVEANENMGIAEHVVLKKDSKVEILGSSAITTWKENGELIQPVLSDLWLHLRIDNRTGWIHGEDDFAAVGLPAGNPTP